VQNNGLPMEKFGAASSVAVIAKLNRAFSYFSARRDVRIVYDFSFYAAHFGSLNL
jgi:hypothetical protein